MNQPGTHPAGISSTSSRTIHVVPTATTADKGATTRAACGQTVTVSWYEVGPQHDICGRCRRALNRKK